jgi:hypothetical protein
MEVDTEADRRRRRARAPARARALSTEQYLLALRHCTDFPQYDAAAVFELGHYTMSDQVRRSREDAIKGIVMRLPTEELSHLCDDFITNPDGLNLNQAIRSTIKRLHLAHSQLISLSSWLICGTCMNKSTSMVMAQWNGTSLPDLLLKRG